MCESTFSPYPPYRRGLTEATCCCLFSISICPPLPRPLPPPTPPAKRLPLSLSSTLGAQFSFSHPSLVQIPWWLFSLRSIRHFHSREFWSMHWSAVPVSERETENSKDCWNEVFWPVGTRKNIYNQQPCHVCPRIPTTARFFVHLL